MKNLKRILLLIALIVIAEKVLFSDLNISETENNTAAAISINKE